MILNWVKARRIVLSRIKEKCTHAAMLNHGEEKSGIREVEVQVLHALLKINSLNARLQADNPDAVSSFSKLRSDRESAEVLK